VLAALILSVLGLSTAPAAENPPGMSIVPISSTTTTASGQPIVVPAHPEVIASIYEIAPNAKLPIHEHPYPRYTYVLSGTLEVTVLGAQTYRYQAGEFFAEVIGQWHTGRNIGNAPVKLLMIDQVVAGRSNTILQSETKGTQGSLAVRKGAWSK